MSSTLYVKTTLSKVVNFAFQIRVIGSNQEHFYPVLSEQLIKFLKLCASGEIDQLQGQLTTLPPCVDWLNPNFKITQVPDNDSSDDDEDDDDEMDISSDDDAPELANANAQKQKQQPYTDEDGWTTIPSRRK